MASKLRRTKELPIVKLQVRVPRWLWRRIKQEAKANDYSLNGEIVARLMGSLIRRGPDDYQLWTWTAWAERAMAEGYHGQRTPRRERSILEVLEKATATLERIEEKYGQRRANGQQAPPWPPAQERPAAYQRPPETPAG